MAKRISKRMEKKKVSRPKTAEDRVTIRNVVDWQKIRAQHDEYAMDPKHMYLHLQKCLGPIASRLEHEDHGEEFEKIPPKRVADLVLCSVMLGESLGFDVPKEVANRMWEINIAPIRGELPKQERTSPFRVEVECVHCSEQYTAYSPFEERVCSNCGKDPYKENLVKE